jgi:hypothetical protein
VISSARYVDSPRVLAALCQGDDRVCAPHTVPAGLNGIQKDRSAPPHRKAAGRTATVPGTCLLRGTTIPPGLGHPSLRALLQQERQYLLEKRTLMVRTRLFDNSKRQKDVLHSQQAIVIAL